MVSDNLAQNNLGSILAVYHKTISQLEKVHSKSLYTDGSLITTTAAAEPWLG